MTSSTGNAAVIVAGGLGLRFGGALPKQYQDLAGDPVLSHTIQAFLSHPGIDLVQVVIGEDDSVYFEALKLENSKLLPPVVGGSTRQASVAAGLTALQEHNPLNVLIHDGARPFVSRQIIDAVLDALTDHSGAFAAVAVSDTLRRRDDAQSQLTTIDRSGLWQAQTPQGFKFDQILAAHKNATSIETDDVALAELSGLKVKIVEGSARNFKITTPADLDIARALLASTTAEQAETRIGFGYDVHRFEEGPGVILGGVTIPHTHKLKGHSDADVALHALTDALLGALNEGDIGDHFPPSDDQWKDAPSKVFLEHANLLLAQQGGRLINTDLTIICEMPKIGPHRTDMQSSIAEILKVEPSRISVKATTTEQLGFTGRGEGIAAQAVVSLSLPKGTTS